LSAPLTTDNQAVFKRTGDRRLRYSKAALDAPKNTKVTIATCGGDTTRLTEHLNKVEARFKREHRAKVQLNICLKPVEAASKRRAAS
jgi:hypothetical protein